MRAPKRIRKSSLKAREIRVAAASCTGSALLSERLGLPVVAIVATANLSESILKLVATEHGSGVLWPGRRALMPINFERDWDDWRIVPFEPPRRRTAAYPFGMSFDSGTILLELPDGVPVSEFREHLGGALRRTRLEEAVRNTAWLDARNMRQEDVAVLPRFASLAKGDFRNAYPADLHVVDPAIDGERMLWFSAAALLAATGGNEARWR